MKIATYNVNGVNGRLPVLLRWLDQDARGLEIEETRRGLPGDDEDLNSRYIEAFVGGIVVGCLLPAKW